MQIVKILRSSLFIRLIGTILMLAVFIWLVFIGNGPLFLLVLLLTVITAFEFYRLMRIAGHQPSYIFGIASAIIIVTIAYLYPNLLSQSLTLIIVLSIVGIGIDRIRRTWLKIDENKNEVTDFSLTVFGALYSGYFLSYIILIRELPDGMNLLLLVLFGAVACDSAAYLVGKYFGQRPFFQRLSPKKTWEGAIGGLISSILTVILTASLMDINFSVFFSLGLGTLVGLSVIVGDLIESFFKRTAGVKDSGIIVPGQGGMLDVIDGLIIALPISYFYILFTMKF